MRFTVALARLGVVLAVVLALPATAAVADGAHGQARASTAGLYGGDRIDGPGFVCQAGFIATHDGGDRVIITAGHCTEGFPTFTRDGSVIGPTVANVFPGSDYGAVRIVSPESWGVVGAVRSGATVIDITTAGPPPPDGLVCVIGLLSGLRCGPVLGVGVTIDTPQGQVDDVIVLDLPPGVGSGGPAFAGSTAVGVVIGGDAQRGLTYLQPVGEALAQLGLTLV